MQELIRLMVVDRKRRWNKETKRLAGQYGQAEVLHMVSVVQDRLQRDIDNEEQFLYQDYVKHYRRFGGQRPFLSLEEYTQASDEFSVLFARRQLSDQPLAEVETQRLAELNELLLKDAFLWADLVPEDPPAIMPELELGPAPASSSGEARLSSASPRRCTRDGFPMLKIKGRWECVAEHLDHCLGQQPIVDLVRHGRTAYYVFENGHELPLLCSCCDGPLMYEDIEQSRQDMVGRRLEGMSIEPEVLDDGREIEALVLQFSKKGWRSAGVGVSVSFKVAAQLRHPGSRSHRPRRSQAKPLSKKKKRRRRKIPGQN
jgi:hypothetical protein